MSTTSLLPEGVDVNATPSDVAVRAEYMYRVLTNFLELLSDDDQEFLSRYWGGQQQIVEDFYLQGYQNDLSKNIFTVPVFRRSRWNEIILTSEAEPATLSSTIALPTYDTSTATGDNTITIIVDGNPFTVTFTDTATNDVLDVMSEINAQAVLSFPGTGGIASIIEDRITLQSFDVGSSATISIDTADANIELGFYPGVSATGSGISTRAEPAQLTGSVASPIFDTSVGSGTNTLTINLNNQGDQTVTFADDATTTIIAVRDSINLVFPNLASMSINNEIVLTSNITGATSFIVIPAGGGNSALGFADGDLSVGCGDLINDPIPERPISYEVRTGTSDDDLNLIAVVDPAIISIPVLRSRIDGPTLLFGQADSPHLGTEEPEANFGTGLDPSAETVSTAYIVQDGRIHFSKSIETQIRNSQLEVLWAEDVFRNDTYLVDNFGFPIQVIRDNSLEYKNVLQGLHHAYWTGPNVKNTEIGLNLLFGLPTAPITGRIEQINTLTNPELIGTEASDVFDVRDANRTFAFTIDGIFIFAIFDPTNAVPVTGPSPSHENYPAALIRDDINAAAVAASLPFPNPADLVVPTPGVFQIRLQGLNSIRIDTITGNAAIGFPPGDVSFGENEIVISGQEFVISTEFPITKNEGDFVERLDPLTDGVEVLHYITDPIWWEVFGLASLDSGFSISTGYSQADLKLINEILKFHVFGVKIVPDAFTRLGNIELGIVSKFVNDIKPLTKNFLFLIPFALLDVFGVTDDPSLDGFPDTTKAIQLTIPHTVDVSNWNQIDTNQNAGIDPSSTSFSAANGGITRATYVDGTFVGDTTGFALDLEVVYASNGGIIRVLDSTASGAPPQRYTPAIFDSQVAGPYNTTTLVGPVNFTLNGVAINVLVGSGPDQIPAVASITAGEIAQAMNVRLLAFGLTGDPVIASSINGELRFISNRYDNIAPTLDISTTYTEIGITAAPGTVTGSAGNLVSTIAF